MFIGRIPCEDLSSTATTKNYQKLRSYLRTALSLALQRECGLDLILLITRSKRQCISVV